MDIELREGCVLYVEKLHLCGQPNPKAMNFILVKKTY